MSHEFELKLEVAPDAAARLTHEAWLREAELSSTDQVSTYYDTAEHELRERGYTLRVRSVGQRMIQTVKSLDTCAGVFDRGEWEYQIEGSSPDQGRLEHTPLAGLDVNRLRPVIRSDVRRTACRLKPNGSLVELDIDCGRIIAAGREQPVSEVEIELLSGKPECVVELARRIARQVPVKLGVLSKAERGFALAQGRLGVVTRAEPVAIHADMTVADGFTAVLAACLRHFRLNEAAVVERRDPEALHQGRVAMRRLRAAMSLFRTAIVDHEFGALRNQLRWFTSELGEARNLDVFLARGVPARQRAGVRKRREHAYDDVIAAIESDRFRTLMLDLVAWSALGRWREGDAAQQSLHAYAVRRIDRLWHKVHGAHDLEDMSDHARHLLRIAIKKLRYSLEFVEGLHGHAEQRMKKFAKAVEDLQEALGNLNDIVVARSLAASDDEWIIPPDRESDEERHWLRRADHALDRMRKAGPYWR